MTRALTLMHKQTPKNSYQYMGTHLKNDLINSFCLGPIEITLNLTLDLKVVQKV